jgi:ectoine hydroxylase-related dioxygenase (phytanoyl-CoA dioxygenase family)/quercetin dioxygenase-like cupin family protein
MWNVYYAPNAHQSAVAPQSLLQRIGCGSDTRPRRVEDTVAFNKSGSWFEELQEFGVTAPFKVYETTLEAHAMAAHMQAYIGKYQQLMDPHIKDRGSDFLVIPQVIELAHSPQMTYIVSAVLGEDFMLSDAEILANEPGRIFQYHRDTSFIGSGCEPDDGIAIWVALRSVTCASTLQVLPSTHRLNITAQEVLEKHQHGSLGRLDAHIANAKIVSDYATQHLGDTHTHVVAADVVDGEAFVFHPRTWHGSMNTANSTRFAVALRYMSNRCHPRLVVKKPPFHSYPWLQPTILVRGKMAANNKQLVNLYEWQGSTSVADGLTPFHLLRHQYSDTIANSAVAPFDVAGIHKSVNPVSPDAMIVFTTAQAAAAGKGPRPIFSTDRLGMFDISIALKRQFGEPPSDLTRHVFSDVTILLTGEVKVTHVIHEDTYVRETIMSNPGAAVITDPMVWHQVTAISTNGSLCLNVQYIPRLELEGPIHANQADPSKLYNPKVSEMTHDGIAFLHPKVGLVGVSPSVVVQSFHLAPRKQLPWNMSVPADTLLIVISGTVTVGRSRCKLSTDLASVLQTHNVLFIPAACRPKIHNHESTKAQVEIIIFQGPSYGDPAELQPTFRKGRSKNDP